MRYLQSFYGISISLSKIFLHCHYNSTVYAFLFVAALETSFGDRPNITPANTTNIASHQDLKYGERGIKPAVGFIWDPSLPAFRYLHSVYIDITNLKLTSIKLKPSSTILFVV
jgi:hypothetical protein